MPIDVPVPPINVVTVNDNRGRFAGANTGPAQGSPDPAMPEHSGEMMRYLKELEAYLRELDARVAALE